MGKGIGAESLGNNKVFLGREGAKTMVQLRCTSVPQTAVEHLGKIQATNETGRAQNECPGVPLEKFTKPSVCQLWFYQGFPWLCAGHLGFGKPSRSP